MVELWNYRFDPQISQINADYKKGEKNIDPHPRGMAFAPEK